MSARHLTPIELTVLGITWKRGPFTTYALMREFQSSTSTYFSSRASTIYPLVSRLEQRGLLRSVEESRIEITEEGLSQLRAWLGDPVPQDDLAHTADLLRLRTFFLAAVSSEQRVTFIDQALADLRTYLHRCELSAKRDGDLGDPFSALASQGVVFETKARIEWLESVRTALLELPAEKPRRRDIYP